MTSATTLCGPAAWAQVAQQAYWKASNTDATDFFGGSLAVCGDIAVIGAPGEGSQTTGVNGDQGDNSAGSSGAAYVFRHNGTGWVQEAYLKPYNTEAGDRFGESVAVSGNTIVVGALFEDSDAPGATGHQNNNSAQDAGAAYVFVFSGSSWTQQAYLKAPNSDPEDWFGQSVAVSGDIVVVGAPGEDSNATGVNGDPWDDSFDFAGAAYVFVRNGTTWGYPSYLKASNTDAGDSFGTSVTISGDIVVVGAPNESSGATGVDGNSSDDSAVNAGAAYVFTRAGTSWVQAAYLKASNTDPFDSFGASLAAAGNTVVVGAPFENGGATGVNGDPNDDSAVGAGAAYVFTQSASTWSQQAYLKASNTDPGDVFGTAVAVAGDTIVVGARYEDSSATDVDGNRDDDVAIHSGAAYVFARNASTWSQEAYLKASNTDVSDQFGNSVSVSGERALVGAWLEDSATTGANGNQHDESATSAGAAYVFDLDAASSPLRYCTGKTSSLSCVPFLSFAGTPSTTATSGFQITANEALPSQAGFLLYSFKKSNLSFHGGKLCVRIPFRRLLPLKAATGTGTPPCAGVLNRNFNKTIQGGVDPLLTAGQTVFTQWVQRDPADPAGFGDSLTNGLRFSIAP